jgi:predicted nucleotidyltransferase
MTNIEDMKARLRQMLLKKGVKKAALFGSQVRGDATATSDIDILVELDEGLSLLDVIGLKLDIEDSLGRRVDLVEYSMLKPALKDRILKEQVTLI